MSKAEADSKAADEKAAAAQVSVATAQAQIQALRSQVRGPPQWYWDSRSRRQAARLHVSGGGPNASLLTATSPCCLSRGLAPPHCSVALRLLELHADP